MWCGSDRDNSGGLLSRLVRDWAKEDSRADYKGFWNLGSVLREKWSLKNFKQSHDLEGSPSSVSCL